jgi:hypothetical protein
VIDPSFNYTTEVRYPELKFHKFIHINIYSETPETGPKASNVGDIIRLRRFRFKYTEKGELMGNDVKFSNWLIYSVLPSTKDISISHKDFEKNVNRSLTTEEATRISVLRKWSAKFFANNSLMYITWWNGYKEIEDASKNSTVYENIDLILKCKSVVLGKKNKLSFIDRDNKSFEFYMTEQATIKTGSIIKLRCVNINVTRGKEITRILTMTKYSSCLIIPPFSSDYKHFEKTALEQKKSPTKGSKQVDPFINDYQIEDLSQSKSSKSTPKKGLKSRDERFVTAIKKLYNTKKVTSVEDLKKALISPTQNHGQKYVIKGYIQDFSTTDPKELIKFLHIDDRRIFKYGEKLDHVKKLRSIFNFVVQVKDDSIGEKDDGLNVYVLTGEFNSHLFSSWKILPEFDEINSWTNVKSSKLNEFQKKLEGVRGADNSVRMVVELMITKLGKPFLKLVDTIFVA